MSKLFPILKRLRIDANVFYDTLKKPDSEKYLPYTIKKKNGTPRKIEKPCLDELIEIQKKLRVFFDDEYSKYKPNQVHGFVKERSIKTNAEIHAKANHKYILKIDIRDFFNSINYERIFGMLQKTFPNLDKGDINALTLQVTCEKHLPQGAPTSPVISNMICKRMDKELFRFAKTADSTYTRYADDITFSIPSNESLLLFLENGSTNKPYELNKKLLAIFDLNGFAINTSKIKVLRSNTPQYICGISIKDQNHLAIRRKIVREIKHELYEVKMGRLKVSQSLVGKISFLRYINGQTSSTSLQCSVSINKLMVPPFPQADFECDKNYNYAKNKYLVYIEPLNGHSYGTGFFTNGYLVTSKHVILDDNGDYETFLKIGYYEMDKSRKCNCANISIGELYEYGEIVFISFNGIKRFENRFLKVSGKIEAKENTKVLSMGCGNFAVQSFTREAKETFIMDTSDSLYGDVYRVEENTIYKEKKVPFHK